MCNFKIVFIERQYMAKELGMNLFCFSRSVFIGVLYSSRVGNFVSRSANGAIVYLIFVEFTQMHFPWITGFRFIPRRICFVAPRTFSCSFDLQHHTALFVCCAAFLVLLTITVWLLNTVIGVQMFHLLTSLPCDKRRTLDTFDEITWASVRMPRLLIADVAYA